VGPVLTVAFVGVGINRGIVSSDPPGIDCGGTLTHMSCTASFPAGTAVTLTAGDAAEGGGRWVNDWEGCTAPCHTYGLPDPEGRTCSVTMNADMTACAIYTFVCDAVLNPISDGSSATRRALVISEINPGDYIELFNTTAAPIALGSSPYWLASPHSYCGLAQLAPGITVPAWGFATVPWPSPTSGCYASFADTDAGGEIILYLDSTFSADDHIMDFVCWGVNPHFSRQSQAYATGKWTSPALCAPALSNGAIHHLANTDGIDASDYDTTSPPTPMNCAP
jgi:hypothetical protein